MGGGFLLRSFLSPLPGWLHMGTSHGLRPWAAIFRRFAAVVIRGFLMEPKIVKVPRNFKTSAKLKALSSRRFEVIT